MEQKPVKNTLKPHYYTQLDALRFFSVFAVTIAHWLAWNTTTVIVKKLHWGHGVLFFFVISGFLITEILLVQKDKIAERRRSIAASLKIFYMRRMLRIFPVYYLLIFILFAINFKNTREIFPYLATYTINIYESAGNVFVGSFNHLWSLAVEEQFYLAWPLFIFLVPQKHLLKFIIATIVLSIASHLCYDMFMPGKWVGAMYLTNNVMYALALGALLAWLKKNRAAVFSKISGSVMATPVFITLYLLVFFTIVDQKILPRFSFLFDDLLFTLFACVVIAKCAGTGYTSFVKVIFENKIIRHLGQISYGLYLFHLFANTVFYEHATPEMMPDTKKFVWLVLFTFTFITAEISYQLVEKPVNSLKKYFNY